MLDYRLFRHQNFLKKVQKKLDFLPKNGKFCVNFSKKNRADARIFFSRQLFFYCTNTILFYFNRQLNQLLLLAAVI